MVLKEKTPNLLVLLTAHAGGTSPAIPVVPRPPTPAPIRASSGDAADKKRKRVQGGKGSEDFEEGKVTRSSQPSPAKEARITKAQQKKNASSRASKGAEGEQQPKASAWRPSFVLSSSSSIMDDADLSGTQKGRLGILAEYLEKALCLHENMQELRSFWKCEVFLTLRRDLAKVYNHPRLFINLYKTCTHPDSQ